MSDPRPLPQVKREQLTRLIPIGSFSGEAFKQVIDQVTVERLPQGYRLFSKGDRDDETYYLLDGKIALQSGDQADQIVASGSEQARYALANLKPRHYGAVAASEILVARVKSEVVDRIISWDQAIRGEVEGYEVTELDGAHVADSHWMLQLMRNSLFSQLPTENIQILISRMERMERSGGDVVIYQGDPGDYFYIIQSGKCLVSRKSSLKDNTVQLAVLNAGQSFGEEALLAGEPRNATVSMIMGGVIMGLAKKDFLNLLQKPVVKVINAKKASSEVKSGAVMIDVRMESEFQGASIKNAINIPLYLLRVRLRGLSKQTTYIVYCDTGARSAAAAFLMKQQGYEVYVLEGGLHKYTKPTARSA